MKFCSSIVLGLYMLMFATSSLCSELKGQGPRKDSPFADEIGCKSDNKEARSVMPVHRQYLCLPRVVDLGQNDSPVLHIDSAAGIMRIRALLNKIPAITAFSVPVEESTAQGQRLPKNSEVAQNDMPESTNKQLEDEELASIRCLALLGFAVALDDMASRQKKALAMISISSSPQPSAVRDDYMRMLLNSSIPVEKPRFMMPPRPIVQEISNKHMRKQRMMNQPRSKIKQRAPQRHFVSKIKNK